MRIVQATIEEIEELGFKPRQLACKCCGVLRVDLLLLQRARAFFDIMSAGRDLRITSCGRCWAHHVEEYQRLYPGNWEKVITLNSVHLVTGKDGEERVASGIDIGGNFHDLQVAAAFVDEWRGGFSFYNRGPDGGSSLHLDVGPRRRW